MSFLILNGLFIGGIVDNFTNIDMYKSIYVYASIHLYACFLFAFYFFISLFLSQVAMSFLILNGLFIGVIVDNFTNIGSENKEITMEAIEEFREVWLKWDPKGTFVMPSHSLFAVLQVSYQP